MVTSKKLNQKGIENVGNFLNQILPDFIKTATAVPGCEILDQFDSIKPFCYDGQFWIEFDSLRTCPMVRIPGEGYFIDLAIYFTFDAADQKIEALRVLSEKADSLWSNNKDSNSKRIASNWHGLLIKEVHPSGGDLVKVPCISIIVWYTVPEDEID